MSVCVNNVQLRVSAVALMTTCFDNERLIITTVLMSGEARVSSGSQMFVSTDSG